MMCYVQSLQLCLTLFDSMNCSPPGSCVRGILQARTVEWVAISSSRGSSQPRDTLCLLYPPLIAQLVKKSTYNAGDPGSIPGPISPPDSSVGKEIHLQCRRPWFDSWVGKIPWRRDRLPTPVFLGFPCGSAGKESTCSVGNLGLIPGLGWEDPLEKGKATHPSILAWRIPRTI